MGKEFRRLIIANDRETFDLTVQEFPEYLHSIDHEGNNILHLATIHNSLVYTLPPPDVLLFMVNNFSINRVWPIAVCGDWSLKGRKRNPTALKASAI